MANEIYEINDHGVVKPIQDRNAVPWSSYAKTGVHNLNGTIYETASNRNGVDWTANADGSAKANGTATGGDSANASDSSFGFIAPFTGMVKLLGGVDTQFYLLPYDWTDSARPYTDSTKTTRVTTVQYGNTPLSFYMEKGHKYSIIARISTGKTVNNVTIYPLLTVLEDPNTEFTSPAMTNQQLTDVARTSRNVFQVFGNSANIDVPLVRENSETYTFGLIVGTAFVYHFWLKTASDSNVVAITKVFDGNGSRTLSATYENNTLKLVFSSTIYGGVLVESNNVA
mgnify:CR=1 FL=1